MRHENPSIVDEIGNYGNYVCSYRHPEGFVEAHLFRTGDTWVAFLSKTSGTPIYDAFNFADEVYRRETGRDGYVAVRMDPYSSPGCTSCC